MCFTWNKLHSDETEIVSQNPIGDISVPIMLSAEEELQLAKNWFLEKAEIYSNKRVEVNVMSRDSPAFPVKNKMMELAYKEMISSQNIWVDKIVELQNVPKIEAINIVLKARDEVYAPFGIKD